MVVLCIFILMIYLFILFIFNDLFQFLTLRPLQMCLC